MQELSSLFKVMNDRGNGAAIARPFSSPYYWAGFQVTLSIEETGCERRRVQWKLLLAAAPSASSLPRTYRKCEYIFVSGDCRACSAARQSWVRFESLEMIKR